MTPTNDREICNIYWWVLAPFLRKYGTYDDKRSVIKPKKPLSDAVCKRVSLREHIPGCHYDWDIVQVSLSWEDKSWVAQDIENPLVIYALISAISGIRRLIRPIEAFFEATVVLVVLSKGALLKFISHLQHGISVCTYPWSRKWSSTLASTPFTWACDVACVFCWHEDDELV